MNKSNRSSPEARQLATDWMYDYNNYRPNIALSGFTPKQRLAMVA